jgi:pSer/pThr/pTyr-binding forkhead associated (FHA) protein
LTFAPPWLTVLDMVPFFASLDGNAAFRLDLPLTLVGRDLACDVSLDSSRVSRRHCCLAFGNGEVVVRDLGSANGTWINGRRVKNGHIRPGDVLGIAHLRFRLIGLEGTEGLGTTETRLHNDVPGQG